MESAKMRSRPAWVWAIAIWFSISALYILLKVYLLWTGALPMNTAQTAYVSSLTTMDYGTSIVIAGLNLSGAVFLFLLRKASFYLFCSSLVLNIVLTVLHAVAKGLIAAIGSGGVVGAIIGLGILLAVCIYSWRLTGRGVLV